MQIKLKVELRWNPATEHLELWVEGIRKQKLEAEGLIKYLEKDGPLPYAHDELIKIVKAYFSVIGEVEPQELQTLDTTEDAKYFKDWLEARMRNTRNHIERNKCRDGNKEDLKLYQEIFEEQYEILKHFNLGPAAESGKAADKKLKGIVRIDRDGVTAEDWTSRDFNSDEPWVEDFDTIEEAVRWLQGKEDEG